VLKSLQIQKEMTNANYKRGSRSASEKLQRERPRRPARRLLIGRSVLYPGQFAKGPGRDQTFFQALVSEFGKPGASFSMREQRVEGDYAYILWSAETADNSYETATDTFVVRNGKIVAQSFAAKITPKR
jgi:hypothetical protein